MTTQTTTHRVFKIKEMTNVFEITLNLPAGKELSKMAAIMDRETGYPCQLDKPLTLAEVIEQCDAFADDMGW